MREMSKWSKWADVALQKMDEPGWECRVSDREIAGGVEGARCALRAVRSSGHEPYYTLKAFVCLNGLEEN